MRYINLHFTLLLLSKFTTASHGVLSDNTAFELNGGKNHAKITVLSVYV